MTRPQAAHSHGFTDAGLQGTCLSATRSPHRVPPPGELTLGLRSAGSSGLSFPEGAVPSSHRPPHVCLCPLELAETFNLLVSAVPPTHPVGDALLLLLKTGMPRTLSVQVPAGSHVRAAELRWVLLTDRLCSSAVRGSFSWNTALPSTLTAPPLFEPQQMPHSGLSSKIFQMLCILIVLITFFFMSDCDLSISC